MTNRSRLITGIKDHLNSINTDIILLVSSVKEKKNDEARHELEILMRFAILIGEAKDLFNDVFH